MSGDECTICEGGGGWWQLEPDADTWRLVECEHCDRTGIEPDPGPIEEVHILICVRLLALA